MAKKKSEVQVTPTGRLNLPEEWVTEQGLRPGDQVALSDLKLIKKGVTRRAIVRYALCAGGWLGAVSSLYTIGGQHLNQWEKDQDTDDRMMGHLFGAEQESGCALFPARDHPLKPLGEGLPAYPIEAECCKAYQDRFYSDVQTRIVRGFPNARPTDNLVIFGSPVSNLQARMVMGSPFHEKATMHAMPDSLKVELRWNHYSPPSTELTVRKQYDVQWTTHKHLIRDSCGTDISAITGRFHPETDYLLITAIPRDATSSRRVIVFSGIHGPGTMAACKLLRQPPLPELRTLSKKIGAGRYYQALFSVSVRQTDGGELLPDAIALVDAVRLEC